jgi:MinD-like ATPase involved in chromosome partitioning or flagellar assembly
MALANIAALLAMWNKRVLVVDWDLEAPGIEHFFFFKQTELKNLQQKPGLIDLLTDLSTTGSSTVLESAWTSLLIEAPIRGAKNPIRILTAGARSEGYFRKVRKLDVQAFYEEQNGGYIIENLRDSWKSNFDFVLVDSRTGITDIGGICTIQLPDILALVFTATDQSLLGAVEVAGKAARKRQELPFERSLVPVLPIPSRFDTQTEHEISRDWLTKFEEVLRPLYSQWVPKDFDLRKFLELTKIPYKTYFSFGEKLPVLEQGTSDPSGLGYAYETVAAVLGNKLQYADVLLSNRDEFIQFVRSPSRLPKLPLRDLPWESVVFIDFVGSSSLRAAFDQREIPQENRDQIFNQYQTIVAECAGRQAGELGMAVGDGLLFAFENAIQALSCAIEIQEILTIRKPIFGPLGAIRVRMAVHAASSGSGMKKLLEGASQIANRASEGQILVSEEITKRLPVPPPKEWKIERLSEPLELNMGRQNPVSFQLFETSRVITVDLKPEEHRALFEQNPGSRSGGGFQALLVSLQEKVKAESRIELSVQDRERIARYAHDYKSGGWQGRLRKIFGRSLGENLGRDVN